MKGVRLILDETAGKRFVQIDLEELDGNREELEDFLDAMVCELRKNEESVSWEDLKKQIGKEK